MTATQRGDPSQGLVSRNFLTLGGGEALARATAFAVTIYLAHQLGAHGFGVVAFAVAVILYLSRIVDLGVDLGLGAREIAAFGDRWHDIVGPILLLRVGIALGTILLVVPIALLLLPAPDRFVVALYSFTLLPTAVSTRWVHLGRERTRLIAAARTAGELLVALLIVALVHTEAHLARVPLAQFLGDGLAAFLLVAGLRRCSGSLTPTWRREVVGPLLKRASPFVASTLLGLLIFNVDVIFLRALFDATTVGYYAAAYAPISLLLNLSVAYSLSLLPTLTRAESDHPVRDSLYLTSAAHVWRIGIPLAVGGTLLAPAIITLVFGETYAASGPILQILLWSIPFSVTRDIPVAGLMARGREDLLLRAVGVSAVSNILLNAMLIPGFGMVGAAAATLTTEMLRLVLSARYARKIGFPRLRWQRVWRPIVAAGGTVALLLALQSGNLWLRVLIGVGTYPVLLLVLGEIKLRREERP